MPLKIQGDIDADFVCLTGVGVGIVHYCRQLIGEYEIIPTSRNTQVRNPPSKRMPSEQCEREEAEVQEHVFAQSNSVIA
jgi:hypothetical protein